MGPNFLGLGALEVLEDALGPVVVQHWRCVGLQKMGSKAISSARLAISGQNYCF